MFGAHATVAAWIIHSIQYYSSRRACGHVDEGTCPHQVLAATLTLSKPGGQIMPTLYWCPHQVLKATDAPGYVEWGLYRSQI